MIVGVWLFPGVCYKTTMWCVAVSKCLLQNHYVTSWCSLLFKTQHQKLSLILHSGRERALNHSIGIATRFRALYQDSLQDIQDSNFHAYKIPNYLKI